MGRTGEVICEEYEWGKCDQNILYKIPKEQNRKRNKAEKHRVEPQKLKMKFSFI